MAPRRVVVVAALLGAALGGAKSLGGAGAVVTPTTADLWWGDAADVRNGTVRPGGNKHKHGFWPGEGVIAGSVALVLRGQSFRQGKSRGKACQEDAQEMQLRQAASLLEHVVKPLEQKGKKVEMFVTETSGACRLVPQLLDAYGRWRIVRQDVTTKVERGGQGAGLKLAFELFKNVDPSELAPHDEWKQYASTSRYELVIITRHDLMWRRPPFAPPANLENINFVSRCEPNSGWGDMCTSDIFHMMPGWLFQWFDRAVGVDGCFGGLALGDGTDEFAAGRQSGHHCSKQLTERLGLRAERLSFATTWRPPEGSVLRDDTNPLVCINDCDGTASRIIPPPPISLRDSGETSTEATPSEGS